MKYREGFISWILLFLVLFMGLGINCYAETEQPVRIYDHLLQPKEHPDYSRRHVQPPDWETFGNQTQFIGLRGFGVENDQIVNYKEELDKYTKTYQLGNIVWPAYSIIFGKNLGDLADEIKKRNLFLFDIWGFVPGSGPGGYWQQYKPPAGVFEMLESKLGDHWLGMDVGEQDGRYIGGYASQMTPVSSSRFEQYLNFQRHFQRMCDDMGNRMSTLVSLNFGHYFLKEGVYTLIGAETAQALPNAQVYYAFIRGAGKQYGVPWFGNASVYNRWGFKSYAGAADKEHGPTKGTSLSLFKRIMYSQVLYNSVGVGFESGWFDEKGNLSPIGKIQLSANEWVKKNGQPGTMLTPVALMTDFYAGWTFPRHLYTDHVYRVWGNLPYQDGDYLTDAVLDMFYPGYQNSSYFHDESGFLTATPYGDSADSLLSDAPQWLLDRYAMLVIAGELGGGLEIRDKLSNYAKNGGHLFITAGNLKKFTDGLGGIQVNGNPANVKKGASVQIEGNAISEDQSFALYPLSYPADAKVIARVNNLPAAVVITYGSGSITVLASPFGIGSEPVLDNPIKSENDKPLAKPYQLLKHVRTLLDKRFRNETLFDAGKDLNWITCRKNPGEYVVGVCNNSWEEKPLQLVSNCGNIETIEELPLDQSEKTAAGYMPEGMENINTGKSSDGKIAGGDIRIFKVKLQEKNVEVIPHAKPPKRPAGRILPLRGISSIQQAILARPTFFEHFDGVLIDWTYLHKTEKEALAKEAGWLSRQGLRIVADISSGLNLYPDLRLIDNDPEEFAASLAVINDVLAKMETLHSKDLLISFHRYPENNFTDEQTSNSFVSNIKKVCQQAGKKNITVSLRLMPEKSLWNLEEAEKIRTQIAEPNLRLAPNVALLQSQGVDKLKSLKDEIGFWMVGAPRKDIAGKVWSRNAPVSGYDKIKDLKGIASVLPEVPIVFDAVYSSQDEEYLDVIEF